MNAYHAAGNSKGIHCRIVYNDQIYASVLQFRMTNQPIDKVFDVIKQQGIVYGGDLTAESSQPGTA